MIPIGDQNTCRRGKPILTWLLIAANALIFVFIQDFGADGPTLAMAAIPSEIALGRGLVTLLTCQFGPRRIRPPRRKHALPRAFSATTSNAA